MVSLALRTVVVSLAVTLVAAAPPRTVSLIAYNDQHARIEESDSFFSLCEANSTSALEGQCLGGFPRISTAVKAWRKKHKDAVFIHAGDEFTGTIWNYVYNGTEAAIFDNAVGVEVATLGNHEFDKGPTILANNYLKKVKFPITACNVHPTRNSPIYGLFTNGPVIKTLKTGLKIGFVGWLTTETLTDSSPGPTVHIADYAPDVQRCINSLHEHGINIIVGIGHAGIPGGDENVIRDTHGLSMVIGGHSHTFMWPPVAHRSDFPHRAPPILDSFNDTDPVQAKHYPQNIKDKNGRIVPYFQALWGTHYMDTVQATFDKNGEVIPKSLYAYPILLGGANSSHPVKQDPAILKLIDIYGKKLSSKRNQVVGYTERQLTRPDSALYTNKVIVPETNMGDLLADSMVWAWQHKANYPDFVKQYGPLWLALENSGGLRIDIPKGNITFSQVLEALPFGDYDFIQQVKGKDLKALLGVGITDGGDDGHLSAGLFSGFKLVVNVKNLTKPFFEELLVKNDNGVLGPVDKKKIYNIITTDYIAAGSSGYDILVNQTVLDNFGEPLEDDMSAYLTAHNPYPGKTDGRLTYVRK